MGVWLSEENPNYWTVFNGGLIKSAMDKAIIPGQILLGFLFRISTHDVLHDVRMKNLHPISRKLHMAKLPQ